MQYELFPDTRYKPARATDPETSHEAAEYISSKLTNKQNEFLRRLQILGTGTSQEVGAGDESIRKRSGELVRAGRIVKVDVRKCRRTGRNATVYGVAK